MRYIPSGQISFSSKRPKLMFKDTQEISALLTALDFAQSYWAEELRQAEADDLYLERLVRSSILLQIEGFQRVLTDAVASEQAKAAEQPEPEPEAE